LGAFDPSTRWAQGGPILEQKGILFHGGPGAYHAWIPDLGSNAGNGPTHLIAAMRCVVFAEIGDEVDIPDDLLAST
jgi:hypothetical protein